MADADMEKIVKKIKEEQEIQFSSGLKVYSLIDQNGKLNLAPLFMDDEETLKKYLISKGEIKE